MEELQDLIKFLKDKGLEHQKINVDVLCGIIEYFAKKQETKQCTIPPVVGQSEQLVCDVCGSTDIIEAPEMGRNCNRCHPL